MRSRRSVTAQPIGMPSRSLKPEMALRALRTVGRWPVMMPMSRAAESTFDLFSTAPLHAHVHHDLGEARDGVHVVDAEALLGAWPRPRCRTSL